MAASAFRQKWLILLMTAAITIFFLMLIHKPKYYERGGGVIVEKHGVVFREEVTKKPEKNWRELSKNETDQLSVLGRILYMEEEPPTVENTKKNYQILVWKYGKTIENRHLKQFGKEQIDPFQNCSVKNCQITYDDEALKTADIVVFHLHRMKSDDLPERRGPRTQIWAFLTDESPYHTFLYKNSLTNYNGVFNWSMTYRMDSDIPVPYGRTIIRKHPVDETVYAEKRRDVLIAIMGSNCGGRNKRWDYVRELEKHIQVDTYGKCGRIQCPGHFTSDCHALDAYLFYLAFENSNCDDYVTEKLWWNAYHKNSIPIVMGATKRNYKKLLPPNSYLNVDDYAHPKDLAEHIKYLNSTGRYRDLYKWTSRFEVLNEHGYFRSESRHYCRVCEALNYNDRSTKVYGNLTEFWSVQRDCHPAWNA